MSHLVAGDRAMAMVCVEGAGNCRPSLVSVYVIEIFGCGNSDCNIFMRVCVCCVAGLVEFLDFLRIPTLTYESSYPRKAGISVPFCVNVSRILAPRCT